MPNQTNSPQPAPETPAILTRDLSRQFGRVTALNNVNFQVPAGALLGLLGPNGSGKTTLLSILAGFITPTSGSFQLLGQGEHRQALARTGSLISRPLLWPHLSCRDNLLCAQGIYGESSDQNSVDQLLARVGLEGGAANRKFGQCSTGMKQRLGIATALIGSPDLLLLDEPTTGLDPEGMVEIRELIKSLGNEPGRTIIMSSHLLHEVELTCDRYAIIFRGNLVGQGEVAAQPSASHGVQIRTTDNPRALEFLQGKGWQVKAETDRAGIPHSLQVTTPDGAEWQVSRDLSEIGIYPLEMAPLHSVTTEGTLEEKYLAAVGRTESDQSGGP